MGVVEAAEDRGLALQALDRLGRVLQLGVEELHRHRDVAARRVPGPPDLAVAAAAERTLQDEAVPEAETGQRRGARHPAS